MPSRPEDNLIKVKILGREYLIRSDEEEKVIEIADYLNRQIAEFEKNSPALNRIDLSVMVAFKAASDYFVTKEEMDRWQKKVESQVDSLTSRIEAGLSE